MSSIAYITDKHMIEFHRIHGNRTMNFWRPGASIRFADFHEGDLLFFLSKGTVRNKEKGIVGYGRLKRSEKLTPNQAWNKYETWNGYHTKEEFFEAIQKLNKKSEFPKFIGSLLLEDVTLFQGPVYPSELGIQISPHLESYAYLDRADEQNTMKILEKAKEVRMDAWSLSLDETTYDDHEQYLFEQAQLLDLVSKSYEWLGKRREAEKNYPKLKKMVKSLLPQLKHDPFWSDVDYIKGSATELYLLGRNQIYILLPLILPSKAVNTAIANAIGRLKAYEGYLLANEHLQLDIQLSMLVTQELDEISKKIIEKNKIQLITIELDT